MEWVEVVGRTVEEAKDRALDLLGVDEAQAEFEVLEEPTVGKLLRRAKGQARVRARVRPVAPRAKTDRRDRRRSRGGREGGGREGGGREGGGEGGRGGGRATTPRESAGERGGNGRRDEPRREAKAAPAARHERNNDEGKAAMRDEHQGEELTSEQQLAEATTFLEGLVAAFGVEATVSSSSVDESLDEVRVDGTELGLLIGPRAGTLDAVQDLTRVVVQRRGNGRSESRLRVDVGGYRAKRRDALERFTRQLAEEVRTTGGRKVLEPMGSADRKVVHDTIGTIDGVQSLSEGEEPRRRVVIVPGE
ncbi:MAG: hypothetical protein FJW83_04420 [Actinobacteria bacterium]|nr:hypothetical protein [Actinomycetota bacterium]